ncbi:hypothetical protein [Mycobacterium camsae]|uniref:hypothetical protein n=1 Tax=Mycobacterium gordonae TaxID=1778 RepID=UPI00197D0AE6|nr:hypothetical protein [Mycobacterium gordonae]
MTATVLFLEAGSRCTVQFAYEPAIVEVLKAVVPAYARSWTKATKQWKVDTDWAQPLASALRGIGCTVIGFDDLHQPPQHQPCITWAQSLFRAVGEKRASAVHRALTKVLHPDNTQTGSHELQQQLNDARSELEERR